jgi:hypothetical protein
LLYNQSFVISQFGGIVTSSDGFKELKRVFYTTLDIIAADSNPQICDSLVNELVLNVQRNLSSPLVNSADIDVVTESNLVSSHSLPSQQAQTAFVLAVIEQLIKLLNDRTIEEIVLPFCIPFVTKALFIVSYLTGSTLDRYLNDPSHREIFESAHSVMLSIFAARSLRKDELTEINQSNLAERLVPFYMDCLIKVIKSRPSNCVNTEKLYQRTLMKAA